VWYYAGKPTHQHAPTAAGCLAAHPQCGITWTTATFRARGALLSSLSLQSPLSTFVGHPVWSLDGSGRPRPIMLQHPATSRSRRETLDHAIPHPCGHPDEDVDRAFNMAPLQPPFIVDHGIEPMAPRSIDPWFCRTFITCDRCGLTRYGAHGHSG